MGYRDPTARITAVDHESAIEAASKTADSIGLSDRFRTIVADPSNVELESEHYDWVVIAQRISGLGKDEANRLLGNATKSLKVGGRLVVIDWVEMDGKPTLADRMASLRLLLETRCGAVRSQQSCRSNCGQSDSKVSICSAQQGESEDWTRCGNQVGISGLASCPAEGFLVCVEQDELHEV